MKTLLNFRPGFLALLCLGIPMSPLAANQANQAILVDNLNSGQSTLVEFAEIENHVRKGERIRVYEKSGQPRDLVFTGISRKRLANFSREISGTWVSEITTNSSSYFNKKRHRNLEVVFEQQGDRVTGINRSADMKIIGERFGNYVDFYILPNQVSRAYEISGDWKFNSDVTRLEGSWEIKGAPVDASGDWNLTRIDRGPENFDEDGSVLRARLFADTAPVEVRLADIDRIEVQKLDSIPETFSKTPSVALSTGESGQECRISEATTKAIENAESAWYQAEHVPGMYSLILEARSAIRPPECDEVRALILVDKAIDKLDNGADPASAEDFDEQGSSDVQKSTPSKSSSTPSETEKAASEACWKVVEIGVESIYFSTLTPVTSVACAVTMVTTATFEMSDNKDIAAYRRLQQKRFVSVNREQLAVDMAQGGGNYVNTMAYLHGCPGEARDRYARLAQRNFQQIFTRPEIEVEAVLAELDSLVAEDLVLAGQCALDS